MKYLCLKDFWMQYESEENGDIPAFKAGDVYEFEPVDDDCPDYLVTNKDHQGDLHYMDYDGEFNEYFVEVE